MLRTYIGLIIVVMGIASPVNGIQFGVTVDISPALRDVSDVVARMGLTGAGLVLVVGGTLVVYQTVCNRQDPSDEPQDEGFTDVFGLRFVPGGALIAVGLYCLFNVPNATLFAGPRKL
jgi:hypothetical protein